MSYDIKIAQEEQAQRTYENKAEARRVVQVDKNGNVIGQGLTFAYEDTNFVTGESPVVLDVNTDLGRNGSDGFIVNDGDGDFTIEISNDGTVYGGVHTLKKGDVFDLDKIDTDSIRITWVADSAYRVGVV